MELTKKENAPSMGNGEKESLSESGSDSTNSPSHQASPLLLHAAPSKPKFESENESESNDSSSHQDTPIPHSTNSKKPESKLSPTASTQHHRNNKMSAKNIIIASSMLLIIAGLAIGLPGFVPALSFMMIGGLLPKTAAIVGITLAATGAGIFGGYSLVSNDESRKSSSESVDSDDFGRESLTVSNT